MTAKAKKTLQHDRAESAYEPASDLRRIGVTTRRRCENAARLTTIEPLTGEQNPRAAREGWRKPRRVSPAC